MCFWKKKEEQRVYDDIAEERFEKIMDLVKDLPQKEYNKLIAGMELCYKGYQKVKQVRGEDDVDMNEIMEAEKVLNEEKEK